MVKTIKTCGCCPFEDTTNEGNFCSLAPFEPPHYAALKWSQSKPPEWCELRECPVTVVLDEVGS